MSKTIFILNGPGLREPAHLGAIKDECQKVCRLHGFDITFKQGGDAEDMIRLITEDATKYDLLIINPAEQNGPADLQTLKLYQSAIRNLTLNGPESAPDIVEVHMENVFQNSEIHFNPLQTQSPQIGFISGLGAQGYGLAIEAFALRGAS